MNYLDLFTAFLCLNELQFFFHGTSFLLLALLIRPLDFTVIPFDFFLDKRLFEFSESNFPVNRVFGMLDQKVIRLAAFDVWSRFICAYFLARLGLL